MTTPVNITALGLFIFKGKEVSPISLGMAYDLSSHGFF